MYTLKDKVAGSLSRLFADSPNHSSPPSPSSPSDSSQVISYIYIYICLLFGKLDLGFFYGKCRFFISRWPAENYVFRCFMHDLWNITEIFWFGLYINFITNKFTFGSLESLDKLRN